MQKVLFLFLVVFLIDDLSAIADDIRDIKPPLSLGLNFWFWLIVLLVIIAFVFGIWLYRKKYKRKQLPPLPPRPAHEVALERLELLRKRKLCEQGLIKEFYIELSDIVRRYIEARFSFRAPEMTTEEFLFSLKYSSVLSDSQKELLKTFLTQCDLVKFAKYNPEVGEVEDSLKSAEEFIKKTQKDILSLREGSRK